MLASAFPRPIAVMPAGDDGHGVSPGPLLIKKQPELFWGLHRVDVRRERRAADPQPAARRRLREPAARAVPAALSRILVFCILGVYAVQLERGRRLVNARDGLGGYLLRKLEVRAAPIVLGVTLAPMIETALRVARDVDGQYAIFLTRPIATTCSPSASS